VTFEFLFYRRRDVSVRVQFYTAWSIVDIFGPGDLSGCKVGQCLWRTVL